MSILITLYMLVDIGKSNIAIIGILVLAPLFTLIGKLLLETSLLKYFLRANEVAFTSWLIKNGYNKSDYTGRSLRTFLGIYKGKGEFLISDIANGFVSVCKIADVDSATKKTKYKTYSGSGTVNPLSGHVTIHSTGGTFAQHTTILIKMKNGKTFWFLVKGSGKTLYLKVQELLVRKE